LHTVSRVAAQLSVIIECGYLALHPVATATPSSDTGS
jgi:hypothetical protein